MSKRVNTLAALLLPTVICFGIWYFRSRFNCGCVCRQVGNGMKQEASDDLLTSIVNRSTSPARVLDVETTSKYYTSKNFLFVLVLSAPKNKDRRDVIRYSWKNSYTEQGKQFLTKFVVGTYKLSVEEITLIDAEIKQYDDMLVLADHLESYTNLTRKVLQSFVWADQNVDFSYLLKTDDDSFLKLDTIESELKARTSPQSLYWGEVLSGHSPTKKGQWKETRWKLGRNYLPYAAGGGYILSRDLVHRIAQNADAITLYSNEDVSVGVWVSPFKLERKGDKRFASMKKSFDVTKCSTYLLIHHQSVEAMKKSHELMKTKNVLCE